MAGCAKWQLCVQQLQLTHEPVPAGALVSLHPAFAVGKLKDKTAFEI